MKKFSNLVTGLLATALLCVASVSPSHAATTVYVSGQAGGNDTNACTLASPCRSIGHGVSVAGNGGTVSCLDAGPYLESFTATTSFTLDCDGVVYVSTTGFGIKVQTANAPVVRFRHVTFDGAAGGSEAVFIGAGSNVVFEDCTFQNFTGGTGTTGVDFQPSAAGAHLTITDSIFTNNAIGVNIVAQGGVKATAVIERTEIAGNTYGVNVDSSNGPTLVDVRYSSIASSKVDGIAAFAKAGGPVASIVVDHSASDHNGHSGIAANGALAFVSLNDSTADWNGTGLFAPNGGTILSYQNNLIAGNLSAGTAPVVIGQQ
jgi:hypothetical protein